MKRFKTDTELADNLNRDNLSISDIRKYFSYPVFLLANSMEVGEKLTQYWKSSLYGYYLERVK